MDVGTYSGYNATVTYSDDSTMTSNDDPSIVTWESSDETVVIVDESGAWHSVGGGEATITATATSDDPSYDGSVSASRTITVLEVLPEYVTVLTTVPETVAIGETGQAVASVHYSNGVNKRSDDHPEIVSWSSSDETLLSIDENGNYEALAAGDVTITATSTEIVTLSSSRAMTIDTAYDFILTVGKAGTDGYYGFSADNYGNVDPKTWGNSDTSEISLALVRPSTPYFYFRATEVIKWNDYDNVKLRFFTETESVETTASNGFLFTEIRPEYAWNEEQSEVAAFLESNYDNDVSVKVIDASLDVTNSIEMTLALFGSSSFNAWGYRLDTEETGEIISGEYHSGSVIEACYARDYYYGMLLQSSVEYEYWNGWEYVTATWEFEGEESHVYAGRLLMHPDQGFYTSGVIDDELNALAQNNIDKKVTITLSQAEIPSNVIEIEIGEVAIDAADDIAYGLRVKSETGELISGEFPDASPIVSAYVRTDGYGCLLGGAFERSYWNYADAITVTWEFEDETSYEFPVQLDYYFNTTTKESMYQSDYIDETLIEMVSSRVGQTAKITVNAV